MRRWLTIALSGLVLSCQGPAAVMAREGGAVAETAGKGVIRPATRACEQC